MRVCTAKACHRPRPGLSLLHRSKVSSAEKPELAILPQISDLMICGPWVWVKGL